MESLTMSMWTRVFTKLNGELVGTDQFGNRYYRERKRRKLRRGGGFLSRERRWVVYNGEPEASRVPPLWHGWLHHTTDDVPTAAAQPAYPWQKEHVPNLTGTALAYRPPGSLLRGGQRSPATGDYERWTPE
jgi:NADH:ubiquinone oxidoreductase subunit